MDYQDKAVATHRATMANFYVPAARLFREHFPAKAGDPPYAFLWPYVGALSATHAMLGLPRADESYVPLLRDLLAGIEKYWSGSGYQASVLAGDAGQRFYDDNAWVGLEFLQIYSTLREQWLLDRARAVFEFVISGWSDDLGGGLYWREGDRATKNTCSNGPAAVLALKLHQLTGDGRYVDLARRIYAWTIGKLRTPEGLYWDHLKAGGDIDRRMFTYNAGIMIQAGLLLHRATGEAQYRQDAFDTAASSLGRFAPVGSDAGTRSFPPTPWFNAVLFRSYLDLHAAGGDSAYGRTMLDSLDYGWQHARDDRGLVHPDWSGRSGAAQAYHRLLDQAPVAEIYALAAQLPAGSSARPLHTGSAGEPDPREGRGRSGQMTPVAWPTVAGLPVVSPLGTMGRASHFEAHGVYGNAVLGPFELTGPAYAYYETLGGPGGPLGFPLSDEEPAPTSRAGTRGFCQFFEGSQDFPAAVLVRLFGLRCGAIVYRAEGGDPHATWYEIGSCYASTGGPAGPLGFPISERAVASPAPSGTRGFWQRFEAGAIYWSAAYGAHPVCGAMAACFDSLGGTRSRMGFPIADASSANRTAAAAFSRQRFEGGWIYLNEDGGAGAIYD